MGQPSRPAPSPSNWAATGQVKLERAKEHLDQLNTLVLAFVNSDAFEIRKEDDPEKGHVIRLRIHREPPLRFGAIAGDVVHQLHSVLNLLWRQAVTPHLDPEATSEIFPMDRGLNALERDLAAETRPRKKAALTLLKEIGSYVGGNPLFALMREIRDVDEHRILIPVYGAVRVFLRKGTGEYFLWAHTLQEDEIVYPVPNEIHEKDPDPEVRPRLGFGNPKSAREKMFLQTMHDFFDLVNVVVQRFRGVLIDGRPLLA